MSMQELYQAIVTYLQRVMSYNLLVVALQLLLIGMVVWWVMRFVRGTRGARLLKGVALLLASAYLIIGLLPKSDEWKRIEFLYGNFLLFALLATVVAFQPELRRALLQIGQTRLFRSTRDDVEPVVASLTESLGYLSRNKLGAIIAVERGDGLTALTQTGTTLDAKLSAALVNTIFYPGSMLHDMGVVVRGDRIVAASCQFPLAESGEVDKSLGSRHRAALGLAQDCDAAILVVSEETGRVSLACEGQLYVGVEPDELREMLLELLAAGRTGWPVRPNKTS